jgi:hypothetical protein
MQLQFWRSTAGENSQKANCIWISSTNLEKLDLVDEKTFKTSAKDAVPDFDAKS